MKRNDVTVKHRVASAFEVLRRNISPAAGRPQVPNSPVSNIFMYIILQLSYDRKLSRTEGSTEGSPSHLKLSRCHCEGDSPKKDQRPPLDTFQVALSYRSANPQHRSFQPTHSYYFERVTIEKSLDMPRSNCASRTPGARDV